MAKLDKHPARQEKRARNVTRHKQGQPKARAGSRRTQLDPVQRVLLGGGLYRSFRPVGETRR